MCTIWTKTHVGTGMTPLVYQMDQNTPLVQETHLWCTNKAKASGLGGQVEKLWADNDDTRITICLISIFSRGIYFQNQDNRNSRGRRGLWRPFTRTGREA